MHGGESRQLSLIKFGDYIIEMRLETSQLPKLSEMRTKK
jgi:hypothetical protein